MLPNTLPSRPHWSSPPPGTPPPITEGLNSLLEKITGFGKASLLAFRKFSFSGLLTMLVFAEQ